MRPGGADRPCARGENRLDVNLRVSAVQGFEDLLFERRHVLHTKDGSRFPILAVAGVGRADRVRVAVERRSH